MKCPVCANRVGKKDVFCPKCGYSFFEDINPAVNYDRKHDAQQDAPVQDTANKESSEDVRVDVPSFDTNISLGSDKSAADVEYLMPPKKKKTGIIIAVASVLALVIATLLVVFLVILPSQIKGDYYLVSYTSDSGSDIIAELCEADKDFPVRLSVSDSKSATVYGMSGDSFSTLSFDKSKQTGTMTYQSGSKDNAIEIVIEKDIATVKDNKDNSVMTFKKSEGNSAVPAADYIISFADSHTEADYLESLVCAQKAVPKKLSLKDNATASVSDSLGGSFASVAFDASNMTGTVSYSEEAKNNAFFTIASGRFNIYDADSDSVFGFIKPDSFDWEKLVADDYNIISHMDAAEGDCLVYNIQNKKPFPASLSVSSGGSCRITDLDGETYASVAVDDATLEGAISISDSGDKNNVILAYKDDTFKIYDISGYSVYTYKRASSVDWDSAASDYVLRSDFYGSDNKDFIKECVFKSLYITSKLELKNDCTGVLYYEDGDKQINIEFDKKTWTGTLTYISSGTENPIYVTYDNGVIRIFDSDYNDVYEYSLASNLDWDLLSGEYVLTDSSSKTESDYIFYLTENKKQIPVSMVLNNDGTGKMLDTSNDTFGEFSIDKETMFGSVEYEGSSTDNDVFIVYRNGSFTVYDQGLNLYYTFVKASDSLFSNAAGDYVLSAYRDDIYPDYSEFQVLSQYMLVNKMTLNDDQTGTLYFSNDKPYAEFEFDKKLMSGEIKYVNSETTNPIFITYHHGAFSIYDTTFLSCLRYDAPSLLDMSALKGEYMLEGWNAKDSGDWIAKSTSDNLYLPTTLKLEDDCTGEMISASGKTFSTFSFDKDTHYGTITISSKKNNIYVAFYNDYIIIYDTDLDMAYTYLKSSKIDLANAEGEYSLSYTESEGKNMLEHYTNNALKIPLLLTIDEDGEGTIKYDDDSIFATFSLENKSIEGTLTFSNGDTEADVYVAYKDNKVGVYFKDVTAYYVFEKNIYFGNIMGEGSVTAMSNKANNDYIAALKKNKSKYPVTVNVESRSKGELFDADKKSYATFSINNDMTGTIVYTNGNKQANAYFAVSGNVLTIYDTTNHHTITCKIGDSD